MGWVGLDPVI